MVYILKGCIPGAVWKTEDRGAKAEAERIVRRQFKESRQETMVS